MESLMEEAPKTDEELRLEIQDPDHSYYVSWLLFQSIYRIHLPYRMRSSIEVTLQTRNQVGQFCKKIVEVSYHFKYTPPKFLRWFLLSDTPAMQLLLLQNYLSELHLAYLVNHSAILLIMTNCVASLV